LDDGSPQLRQLPFVFLAISVARLDSASQKVISVASLVIRWSRPAICSRVAANAAFAAFNLKA